MRVLLAALVFLLASVSVSFGQMGIPSIQFICLDDAHLFDIMTTTRDEGPDAGGDRAAEYVETYDCWHVSPTYIEVLEIVVEIADHDGKLWALALVRPHEVMNFTRRLPRYAILDAGIARAYITRHNINYSSGQFTVPLACLELNDVLELMVADHEHQDGGWGLLEKMIAEYRCMVFETWRAAIVTEIYHTALDSEGDETSAIGFTVPGKPSREFFSIAETDRAVRALQNRIDTSI